MCNVEIWFEQTLILLKVARATTEKTILLLKLKYQNQVTTAALNGDHGVMFLRLKSWIYQVLSYYCHVGMLHWSRIKFLIWNFTVVLTMILFRIGNLNLQISLVYKNSSENWCYGAKMRAPLNKKWLHQNNVFKVSGNLVRQRKVYKMMVEIQNSSIRNCHEFHWRALGKI